MVTVKVDAKGLRRPQPVLKVAAKMPELTKGDLLEVEADCFTFEDDMRTWCDRVRKTLLSVRSGSGSVKVITIRV
jgi:tRNA 2-thiouridine synthesizing protein A